MPSLTTNEKRTVAYGLGEIALRVNNLDAMQKFYEQVIGLPLRTRVANCAFFKIAGGLRGSHPSARLVRPLGDSRLSRDRRSDLHD
jgi:catechol 2,3-dioxygenase-like lactoylglutathione lyase family enzyme